MASATMHARCPHCSQVFTAERPGRQFCPRCGQQVEVGASRDGSTGVEAPGERAAPGWEPVPPARQPTPWEERRELGLVRAFARQWKETMVRPQAFWPTVRPEGPWLDALLYGWLISVVVGLLGLPLALLSRGESSPETLERLREMLRDRPELLSAAEAYLGREDASVGVALGGLLVNIVLYPLVVFAVAALVHLGCLVFGAARNGFWATFRVVLYGSAPFLLGFLPCVGPLLALYACVQFVLGVQSLQETSGGRAAGAVLAPLTLFACCTCAGVAGLAGALAGGGAG